MSIKSPDMIKKLKFKFIALSMSSLFILLAVMVTGMNLINFSAIVRDTDEILTFLSSHSGRFPGFDDEMPDIDDSTGKPPTPSDMQLPPNFSPELPYESRYFSVLIGNNNEIIFMDMSKVASIGSDTAEEYVSIALGHHGNRGFVDKYRFEKSYENGAVRVTFLDCEQRISSLNTFLYSSIFIALVGFIIVFGVMIFFSGRIVRPIVESHEKQKRFISDAGHEIKTPLTIINANVDLIEMEDGDNEYLADIRQQTSRLTKLTENLVYLARMDESAILPDITDIPISEIVQDTAESFKALATVQNRDITINVQPVLTINGNKDAIVELVSILLDNAIKYSTSGSSISVSLSEQGRGVLLTVSNPTDSDIPLKDLPKLFDRFYRPDSSRNSKTGGYGIGLSLARAIVASHGGKISAVCDKNNIFSINVTFTS